MKKSLKILYCTAFALAFCFLSIGYAAVQDTLLLDGVVSTDGVPKAYAVLDDNNTLHLYAGMQEVPEVGGSLPVVEGEAMVPQGMVVAIYKLPATIYDQRSKTNNVSPNNATVAYNTTNAVLSDNGDVVITARDVITSVVIETPMTPLSLSGFFQNLAKCVSIEGLDKIDTSLVTNMASLFSSCKKLTELDLSCFDTSKVENMASMFDSCNSLETLTWNKDKFTTANVTSMSRMFFDCGKLKAIDLSEFDTSNVAAMDRMFYNCGSLTELDVSSFNTSKITNMVHMFDGCRKLTSLNVSNFQTQNVWSLRNMFFNCSGLTSLDLSNFNTAKVTTMENMFNGCSGLASLDISNFNTGMLKDASSMFRGCGKLTSLDVSHFNTSNVEDMSHMFYGCSQLQALEVSGFNTAKAKMLDRMFCSCSSLTELDVSGFVTSEATDMTYMFGMCRNLTSLDVSGFDTGKVTLMVSMFDGCSKLTNLDVADFNTGNVTNMANMFQGCTGLTSLDVTGFNTQKVQNMIGMFTGCENLTSLDVTRFDTSNVTTMNHMFSHCKNLVNIDLSKFNTQKVTDMFAMFYSCIGLTSLDLSGFDTQNVTYMSNMFAGCTVLKTIFVSEKFVINEEVFGSHTTNKGEIVDHDVDMFQGCLALTGGAGTSFSWGNANDATYAHIDGVDGLPGYFTLKDSATLSPATLNVTVDSNVATGYILPTYNYPSKDTIITLTTAEGATLPESVTVTAIDGNGNPLLDADGNEIAPITYISGDGNYDSTTGKLIIPGSMVKANVSIRISTVAVTQLLEMNSLVHLTAGCEPAEIIPGQAFAITLTPDAGYVLPDTVTVTINGEDKTAEVTYENGVITIPATLTTGNITISITAEAKQQIEVTDSFADGLTATYDPVVPIPGQPLTVYLVGETFPEAVMVKIDGVEATTAVYDKEVGTIIIPGDLLTATTTSITLEAVEITPAVCTCEIKCTELTETCEVCKTDITDCVGTETPTEADPICTCVTKCTELTEACEVCKSDISLCKGAETTVFLNASADPAILPSENNNEDNETSEEQPQE